MKKIRIGNDIHFKWMITREGAVENFDGKQVDVELRDQTGRRWPVKWSVNADDGCVDGIFYGHMQQAAGTYSLTLTENRGGKEMATVDRTAAWQLVARQDNACEGTDESALGVTVDQMASEISLSGGVKTDKVEKKKKRQRIVIGRAVNLTSLQDAGTVNVYCFGSQQVGKRSFSATIPFCCVDFDSMKDTTLHFYAKGFAASTSSGYEKIASVLARTNIRISLRNLPTKRVVGVVLDKFLVHDGEMFIYISTYAMPHDIPNPGGSCYFRDGKKYYRMIFDAVSVVRSRLMIYIDGKKSLWERIGRDKLYGGIVSADGVFKMFCNDGLLKRVYVRKRKEKSYVSGYCYRYVSVHNQLLHGAWKRRLGGFYKMYKSQRLRFSHCDEFITFRICCRYNGEQKSYRITVEDIKKGRC